jgi:hypothetical protein
LELIMPRIIPTTIGVSVRPAWIGAYALERSLVALRHADQADEWVLSRDELIRRFTALPADQFPQTRRYAAELTAGVGNERFDFTLSLITDNLTQPPAHNFSPSMPHQQPGAPERAG